MSDESMGVSSSSTMVEAPSQPTEPAPAAPAENGAQTEGGEPTPQPTEPTVELFDLPDGRKVDAATLSKEWKENFMPDYTRKSQELARANPPAPTPGTPITNNNPTSRPYENPDWTPKSYAEIIDIAKQEMKEDSIKEQERIAQERMAIENAVVEQLNAIKAIDPKLDENALFHHASKYGFRDLRQAHANMKDMVDVIKKTQTTTAQNIVKRNDPVSINPGATGARPNPSNFGTTVEYLRSLK